LSNSSNTLAHLARRVRAALRDRCGIATIEFGVVTVAVITIILGTYDIGNFLLQQMKLAEAAGVGGQFLVSFPSDNAGLTTAIGKALPPTWDNVTTTGPTMSCACWNAAGGQVAASCNATPICPVGQQVRRFMTISLQRNYTPLLLAKILTSTTASYVVEVQ
jgi:Flp pilus assembly protein TadG